ncbi:hypothetical protein K435DRAFT_810669 [Dendrothele bispora CBS 962.96]|uniref:Uncharacterized protein n=1 Tax=Dendrothele bispora (strain CBS 962.96) TaxID=1314807 RepID=A0A4S8KUQ5_DENBC|nr:hypothetical protein K435DRAFT_810669 [Dendrothele bispora CBS 962.96]
MKWDENEIAVCGCYPSFPANWNPPTPHFTSLFTSSRSFRAAVPAEIVRGTPNPSQWGSLVALEPGDCDPMKNFGNHSIVFGTNKIKSKNASWSIDYVKVYKKQLGKGAIALHGKIRGPLCYFSSCHLRVDLEV